MNDLPERIRAFVAIRLDTAVEDAIADFVATSRNLDGVRWVPSQNLHVTLRFLGGDVSTRLVVALDARLRELAKSIRPFRIEVKGVGIFPDRGRPRVLWIGLQSEHLIALASAVEQAARDAGFSPEARPYLPHLTIGRMREVSIGREIRSLAMKGADHEFGSSLICHLSLYRSVLGGPAATYHEIGRYVFDAGIAATPG